MKFIYMLDNEIICFCFNLSCKDIKNLIEKKKLYNLEDLARETRITLACGACKDGVISILDSVYSKNK